MWSEYQQGFDLFRNVSIYVMKLRKVEVTGERKTVFTFLYWYICILFLFSYQTWILSPGFQCIRLH